LFTYAVLENISINPGVTALGRENMMMRFVSVLSLIFAIGAFAPAYCVYADDLYPPVMLRDETCSKPTQAQKMWALATCAVLTEYNRGRHDVLGGCERTEGNIRCQLELLASWWGIRSRKDLFESLKWIEDGGHRKIFDELASSLGNLSPEQIAVIGTKFYADPEIGNRVAIALRYHKEFGPKSIASWDYARYVSLCGWGYLVGYITEDEAWQRIMPAARLLQRTFGSWEDLGRNYLGGREFWSLRQTIQGGQRMRECYRKLLADSSSPWVVIPWDIDLGALQHVTRKVSPP
jgi:hypothetical protein